MSAYRVAFVISFALALVAVVGAILYFLTCKGKRPLKLHSLAGHVAALALVASVVAVWYACTAHPGVRVGLTILVLTVAVGGVILGPIALRACKLSVSLLHYALGIVAVVLYLILLRPVLSW